MSTLTPERIEQLLPKAVAWAKLHAAIIERQGQPLTRPEQAIAGAVGVSQPDQVRVLEVPRLPQPTDPELLQAAQTLGLLGPNTTGLTLGRCIYVREGQRSPRLLAHELRHVQQVQHAGSLAAFLAQYLQQLATCGYAQAPYEIDARRYERYTR